MAKAFLLVGNTGAGKSTFAAKLATRENAHVFAGDEWMKTLFMMDQPDPMTYQWALERTQRIETQILNETKKILARDINVILDIGFFAKSQRKRVQKVLQKSARAIVIHFFDIDKATRWKRIEERNIKETETYQFHVSKTTFDYCDTLFEPLDRHEQKIAIIHRD